MKVVAIILAAGEPKSLPHNKSLLEHDTGKSFLRSVAGTFAKAGAQPIAVIGHQSDAVREQHPDVDLIENPKWRDGLLSSVKTAVTAALEDGADVIALHPVDQPAVRASTLKKLLGKTGTGTGVVPVFENIPGAPLVLSRSGAERLLKLGAAAGLPAIATELGLTREPTQDPGVLVNINTPEVYERLFGSAPKLAPPPKKRGKKKTDA